MPAAVGRLASSAQVGTTSISSVGSGGSSPVEHVDDDDGDVVAAPGRVGGVDESLGRRLRVAVGQQHRRDVRVGDLVDQPVAAEHEPVASDERERPPVDAHLGLDAEGARDDVAARVRAGLVLGDVSGGDQFLDVAVVDRHSTQPAVAEQVGARVADVGEHERFRRHHRA